MPDVAVKTAYQILEEAIGALEAREEISQSSFCHPVGVGARSDPDSVKCTVGYLSYAATGDASPRSWSRFVGPSDPAFYEAMAAVARVVSGLTLADRYEIEETLCNWNNATGRTTEDVLAAYRTAQSLLLDA